MTRDEIYRHYQLLYDDLKNIASQCNQKLLEYSGNNDENIERFFFDNANFLTKSLLINICAYLELYIREITTHKIEEFNREIKTSKVPYNLVKLSLQRTPKDLKDNELSPVNFEINLTEKDLDFHVSGNPYKTIRFFKRLGIYLEESDEFEQQVFEAINAIVYKRNQIIHHNDDASDITFSDIIQYIDVVLNYMMFLNRALMSAES